VGEPEVSLAQKVLLTLADLAPSAEGRTTSAAIPTEWFRWLPLDALRLFVPPAEGGSRLQTIRRVQVATDQREIYVPIDRRLGERLAAVDQLRPAQRSLRVGWLFVTGRTVEDGGRSRRVFHPLVTVPVRVERLAGARLVPAGDVEVSDLIADRAARETLERGVELGGGALDGTTTTVEVAPALLARLGRLQKFARSAAAAAHLPATQLIPATGGPDDLMRQEGLVIVAGTGVYAVHETGGTSRASSLRLWASGSLDEPTAFHSLYLDVDDPPAPYELDSDFDSPFLLTPVQGEAVARSRRDRVVLISGAPGTGKSHTIAAIACDALGRGETVLVAAKSDATVDALLELLERSPGPDPVVFGSNERREGLAARLSAGQLRAELDETVEAAAEALALATRRRNRVRELIADQLAAEHLAETPEDEVQELRAIVPGLFEVGADLSTIKDVLDAATASARTWWARRRRVKAERLLRRLTRSGDGLPLAEISDGLRVARGARVAADLAAHGGLDLGELWGRMRTADDAARAAHGHWLAVDSRSGKRLNRSTLGAVAALATALRSGRSARRDQLRRLKDAKLTRALPLWVGTLADVDDLLPAVSGLFDLVILDEASSIDQVLAAPALLRGARAVVAGDPHQLRHVSFLADEVLESMIAAHGLTEPTLVSRLDVRRNSIFDVAAGVAPVTVLDEHFRSRPHLVEFVAGRLYGGQVRIATRSPPNESKDCITLVRLTGGRDDAGVVKPEVDRSMVELRALLRSGVRSVGLVTPFRAQADALEEAALHSFNVDELEALDLRIGTVHAFQGIERDVVIASFGLGPDNSRASWRFVEDPHLLAVLVTRARDRLILLLSADPPEAGLVRAYLDQADRPPLPPRSAGPVSAWASSIAEELKVAGIPVITAYPSGRHEVDVCLHIPDRSLGIECGVHPDGPAAHMQRHLDLERRGWKLIEAYRSRWADRRAELVVEVLNSVRLEG
jgi:hypothetical protein